MKTISLFSGCGGMDFGAEAAGAKVIFSNDIDHDSCETLRKYFPEQEVFEGDVAKLETFPAADLVIGGYPCQSFSLGGKRNPEADPRTKLYLHFVRCVRQVQPKYFVAENVSGLKGLKNGAFFKEQLDEFEKLGYRVSEKLVDAKDYGVPQIRKRLIIVGIRKDLEQKFQFPEPTHGIITKNHPNLIPYASHGEAIKDLPLWPKGEFYERPHDPEGHMSWYYMSRNRKKNWDDPAFTVVANWRHITLHPASPTMKLSWSNLKDGFKQRWDFTDHFEHTKSDPTRPVLKVPRRLSWRECARIQTFPNDFEPVGNVESKFQQIGNAVPPLLAQAVFDHLLSGKGLVAYKEKVTNLKIRQLQIELK
ncbi:DNA cytosine methyltransferase [Flavisolibacter ginsengisoli]|jgi:DNA (cytosine-5)-methyltransferase 1|uniref:Cytosine-specific methyltransferase n=1 Tax=Flavisolibacter ginsengisoli DSM 18119 TaxID=1121884 RepID=A0A1M5CFL9_9BACT|nr:DNA cytosine methyltransferase [Flavisolibacter ginsengisoli]SHF53466.1 DNA (cytosine-5)-methyltransferase 1 [Flavisolibacter ginsengisoli DSM 18119]